MAAEYVGGNDEGTSSIDGIGQVVRSSFGQPSYLTGPVTGYRPVGLILNEEHALPAQSNSSRGSSLGRAPHCR